MTDRQSSQRETSDRQSSDLHSWALITVALALSMVLTTELVERARKDPAAFQTCAIRTTADQDPAASSGEVNLTWAGATYNEFVMGE